MENFEGENKQNDDLNNKKEKQVTSPISPNLSIIPLWFKVFSFIIFLIEVFFALTSLWATYPVIEFNFPNLISLILLGAIFIYGVYFISKNDKKYFSKKLLTSSRLVNFVFATLLILQILLSFLMLGMGLSIMGLSGAGCGQSGLMLLPLGFTFIFFSVPIFVLFLLYYLIVLTLQKKGKIIFYKFPHLLVWGVMTAVPIVAFIVSFFMILIC